VIILRKINDRICLGILIGLLANIPKILNDELWYLRGDSKRRFSHLVAGIFLPYNEVKSKEGTGFGLYMDMFISSLLGIPLVYLLTYTGKDKSWIKGIVTGLFGFSLFRGLLARTGIGKTYPKDVSTNVIMSISSLLWGITAGLLISLLGNKDLFKPKPHIQSNPPDVIQ
jgi:hypothetical protein